MSAAATGYHARMSDLEHVGGAPAAPAGATVLSRDAQLAVFAHTMGLVALTCGVAALGAYVGRDISRGAGIFAILGAFACLLGMNAAVRRSERLATGLLFGVGALIGISAGPLLAAYARVDPAALWQSAGATALFVAGFGAAGYATRRDLTQVARVAFWALLGLIVFGLVLVFTSIPNGRLVYSLLGLVVFAAFTLVDFQRLRRAGRIEAAPLLAAAIFLDVFNVFLFFLSLFGGRRN